MLLREEILWNDPSYNLKPHSLEFMHLEQENSYTRRGYKIWILN